MQKDIVLKMENISKSFPGVLALDKVSLELKRGEIHAIMGENGAGKSTLMKVLSGAYQSDDGEITIEGQKVNIRKPSDAAKHGVAIVYQEQNVFAFTSVTENIFLSDMPLKGKLIDYKTIKQKTVELMEKYRITHIDINKECGQLSVGQQQMVEILRATSQNVKILVLDEPTSALTEVETKILYEMMNILKSEGVSILYISHRLQEIFDVCDRVTVMRDGKDIDTLDVAMASKDQIVSLMVGRSVAYNYGAHTSPIKEVVLDVKNLQYGSVVKGISFELHSGEVLGVAGLEGSGRTEMLECLFGVRKMTGGTVLVNGALQNISSPIKAKKLGIAYITKNRKKVGLFMRIGVAGNIVGASLKNVTKHKILNKKKIQRYADEYIEKFEIKTPDSSKLVAGLSGGNQQKVLLAMWLILEPKIMLIDEPTRGIDVGTKEEIHKLIRNMAKEGTAVLVVSSDMQEILGASDRVLVLHEGQENGILEGTDINEITIVRRMSGLN
ncbi:MAG: sugar ABC transporter ATP-binding protein [Oscillospiraceae bacterium]